MADAVISVNGIIVSGIIFVVISQSKLLELYATRMENITLLGNQLL